jgi:ABC-type multidrug transport system ATPase subunit
VSIRAEGVTVAYGDTTIVDHVDLDVADGEWLGLLGPNGAGKTTLLRTLVGLVRRDAGTVSVGGIYPDTTTQR